MPFGVEPLILSDDERRELQQMTQSRTLPAGRRHESPDDFVAGRWSLLPKDTRLARHDGPHDRALEESISATSYRRPGGRAASRPTPIGKDTQITGQGDGCDQGRTERWLDSLVVPETGKPFPRHQGSIQRILAQADVRPHRLERYVASERSGFRDQSNRCDRIVLDATAASGRVLRG